ncbi:MAG: aminopeptidase P family protein [Firmicutes bacterium]|nr:aminopeptidase P family protein [Bacillota bacterium]
MRKQLTNLRQIMTARNIDACLIPTTDFHNSEYVNDYFKSREFISGFTGSAGTLVITPKEAKLWTDGRYFLQAAAELNGTGIDLMKMGQPEVPTIQEYLESVLDDTSTLAFDGRVVDNATGSQYAEKFNVIYDVDLPGEIWPDRPEIVPSKIYPLSDEITGESAESKLKRIRRFMAEKHTDYHLISQLEDIAWLYNLRGNDIKHTPVFFAFALITAEEDRLYVLDDSFKGGLPYLQIFEDLSKLPAGTMLLNKEAASYALCKAIPEAVQIIDHENPCTLMKALKNQTEISATKNAHLKDGAAMVEFLYWLKNHPDKSHLTEIAAADYLASCRAKQEGFQDLSFATISGYGENGAIVHYDPTPETDKKLHPEGFLLVDSGGQYTDGTTDITRTIALGPLSEEMKQHYTAVLKGHIALARAKFATGTTGAQLDPLARKPLQDLGLNYNHGTGHGVGHLLSVHEGPQTISPRGTKFAIQPGMITSNEPGVYMEGSHGIRLENEILCVENTDGQLEFETITFCPFDCDAILADQLTEDERNWINDYHAKVYDKIAPLISVESKNWLYEATKKLPR